MNFFKKNYKWITISIGTILGLTFFLYNAGWILSRWEDLFLNILSEVFGIGMTVFLVDRIIKNREDKLWEPVRNYAYAKIIGLTARLIVYILPEEYLDLCEQVFYIGPIKVSPFYITNESFSQKPTELAGNIMYKVDSQKQVAVGELSTFVADIDELLSKYSNLVETEILLSLLTLKERMETTISLAADIDDYIDTFVIRSCQEKVSNDLLYFVQVSEHLQYLLLKKANRMEPLVKEMWNSINSDNLEHLIELDEKMREMSHKATNK